MARKSSGASKVIKGLPDDVATMTAELGRFLNSVDPETGRRPADAKYGVYGFFDYDGEPIYCGQTAERLRVRIRRHLTNQRTDAVAMRVLDPLEVAEVEIWPLWEIEDAAASGRSWSSEEISAVLNAAEYTLFEKLLADSQLGRILNEKIPASTPHIELPRSFRAEIVPTDLRLRLGHADLRIARRAQKIAELAGIIAQRDVSVGLRSTLVTQAERLLSLAQTRFAEITEADPQRAIDESFGNETDNPRDSE